MRYFLKISFDGTRYHGWQLQANAHSVQAEIDRALSILLKTEINTAGCGRTDTGVHARVYFLHFDVAEPVNPASDFIHHLNSILPKDIAAHQLTIVNDKFHARFDATSRTYEYRMYHSKNPFLNASAWFYPYELDPEKMNAFAQILLEYSDFASFAKSRTQTKTSECKITYARWSLEGNELVFRITANRFLRNMVRAIVGTLVQAGRDRLDEKSFREILDSRDRQDAGPSVPAHGLYLTDVTYPFL